MIVSEKSVAKRKLPLNLSEKDLPLFTNALEGTLPAVEILTFTSPGITGQSIVFEGMHISPESFIEKSRIDQFRSLKRKIKFLFAHHFLKKKIRIDDRVLWFTDSWSHEYFHWMTDALPRLLAAKEYIPQAVVLLPEKYKNIDYIQRSIKAFPIRQIMYLPEQAVAWPKGLVMPAHTAPTGNYNESLLRGLRDLFATHYKNSSSLTGDKVYISRSKALRRKVVNELELIPILQKFGFKMYSFEDYNFDEQARIIQNASYLISNHGAGLTNMLFMKSGGSVLELRRQNDNHNNCYFSMASGLDLKYYYQLCKTENNEEDTFTANLIVDPAELEKNIERMLG